MANSRSDTLIIADCHGHCDRLEALLTQEKVIIPDEDYDYDRNPDLDVRVIHLGDLIHVGAETQQNDAETLNHAYKRDWIDEFLWGNHDRAIVDSRHAFNGFYKPFPETDNMIQAIIKEGRYKLAAAAHGYLITHAGLGPLDTWHPSYWNTNEIPTTDDPVIMADILNHVSTMGYGGPINGIGYSRGGRDAIGGILWRDMDEPIETRFNQIFGHTAQTRSGVTVQHKNENGTQWFNIDIGGKSQRKLAGIWLTEKSDPRVVRVDL